MFIYVHLHICISIHHLVCLNKYSNLQNIHFGSVSHYPSLVLVDLFFFFFKCNFSPQFTFIDKL